MNDQTLFPENFDVVVARQRCLRMRRRVIGLSQKVGALHIAPAFSCLEIVDTIYFGMMRRGDRVENPDTFILSKGHGAVAQYAVLEELGVLSQEDMDHFCTPGGRLGGHPDYGVPGIEASTGSLGHGLGIAVGMAIADKVFEISRRIYVVLSDGELQEGATWEAILFAPNLHLSNLIVFVDLNDFQTLGQTSQTHPNFYPVLEKIQAFGWEVIEVDGHNPKQILDVCAQRKGLSPFMVIGRTTKGKGVSYMENQAIWHYRSPSPEEYKVAMRELEAG